MVKTERMNHTVEDMLRHFVYPTVTTWDELLLHVQFAINNAWQELVQNTPFYLNHGRHPRTPLAVSLVQDKGRSLSQKGKNPAAVLLLLLQHICSKPLLTPSAACLMHSTGRSVTVTKGMFLLSLKWAL